jgi:hypothetical protein
MRPFKTPLALILILLLSAAVFPQPPQRQNGGVRNNPGGRGNRIIPPAGGGDIATLPRSVPDSSLATTLATLSGNIITVNSGDNLQTAFNNAVHGDTININFTGIFTGNFTLPVKSNPDNKYIWVKSSATIVSEGTRAVLADNVNMPKIKSSNTTAPITLDTGGGFWRFTGVDVSYTGNVGAERKRMFSFGQSRLINDVVLEVPTNIILDRVIIRMDNSTDDVVRGVMLNARNSAVIDSSIYDIHHRGSDSQAVNFWNTPGNIEIRNCFLNATGENLMIGGGDPASDAMLPRDITISRCHLKKSLSWYELDPSWDGQFWSVKNILELKLGQYVLIEGCVLENCWEDAQNGMAFSFKITNQDGTAGLFAQTLDVTARKNIVDGANMGLIMNARDADNSPVADNHLRRVLVEQNLFTDINWNNWKGPEAQNRTDGLWLQMGSGVASPNTPAVGVTDSAVRHNTVINNTNGSQVAIYFTPEVNAKHDNFKVEDNLYWWIIRGDGTGEGVATFDFYTSNLTWRYNLNVAGNSAPYGSYLTGTNNAFPASVSFVDFAGASGASPAGYALTSGSTYSATGTNPASDNTDRGANISQVISATSGVVIVGQ